MTRRIARSRSQTLMAVSARRLVLLRLAGGTYLTAEQGALVPDSSLGRNQLREIIWTCLCHISNSLAIKSVLRKQSNSVETTVTGADPGSESSLLKW